MKGSQIFGIIVSLVLIVFGVAFPTPKKYVNVNSYSFSRDKNWIEDEGIEYVGGDAYNYQMEASLKAGYISGVLAMKAITFVGGVLLLFISLFSHIKCNAMEDTAKTLSGIRDLQNKQIEVIANQTKEIKEYFNSEALKQLLSPNPDPEIDEHTEEI